MSNVKSFEEANGNTFGDILSEKKEKKNVKTELNGVHFTMRVDVYFRFLVRA